MKSAARVAETGGYRTIAVGHKAVTSIQGCKPGPGTLSGRLTQSGISMGLGPERALSLSLWVSF